MINLQSIDQAYQVQISLIHCDNIYDLLQKYNLSNTTKPLSELSLKNLVTLEQFESVVQEALQERKRLSYKMQDHEIRKRSHFVV